MLLLLLLFYVEGLHGSWAVIDSRIGVGRQTVFSNRAVFSPLILFDVLWVILLKHVVLKLFILLLLLLLLLILAL